MPWVRSSRECVGLNPVAYGGHCYWICTVASQYDAISDLCFCACPARLFCVLASVALDGSTEVELAYPEVKNVLVHLQLIL